MTHHHLDARNLLCPMPVIRTQNLVASLAPGDTIEVSATDPGALDDIPAWCRVNGHTIIATVSIDGEVRVTLQVGA